MPRTSTRDRLDPLEKRARRAYQLSHGLAQALGRLQAVMDHAPVGIAFARSGLLELVSEHFARMFGRHVAQMTGQPTSIMHATDDDRTAFIDKARAMFDEHGACDAETRLARADGSVFWGRMRGRAVDAQDPGAGTIWIVEDVSHAREEQRQLTWAAEHDPLTRLVNRRGFESRLERVLLEKAAFSVLFVDLDRFKPVNDSAGHAAGDRLLAELASRIAATVRESDTVARLGGDEFALLMPLCPPARALVIAERIRSAVERYRLHWEGAAYGVGASIGVVHDHPTLDSSAAVLAAADAACYAAKRGGRNRVVVWQPGTTPVGPG